MPSIAAFSGVDGVVLAGSGGSVDMNISAWSADVEVDEIDVSNTSDAGYANAVAGLKKISGSFDFPWDPANPPTGASAGLSPGGTVSLVLTLKTGLTMTGSALVTKLSVKSGVNEAVLCTCSFRNKGAWTLPS